MYMVTRETKVRYKKKNYRALVVTEAGALYRKIYIQKIDKLVLTCTAVFIINAYPVTIAQ